MSDHIFETYAPLYWSAGLPVIPLRQRNKMPDIHKWSVFGSRMPTDEEQQHWLASFPKGNIGLPFGPASGLCAIDIDTEDEALVQAILDILPETPWVRVGKKGMGLAYRWEGQKNFKLRGADGGMICEFLGLGNQMVMPPSIHPDCAACGNKNVAGSNGTCTSCGAPSIVYSANSNLWEVLGDIPDLAENMEQQLRELLGSKGFALGAGGRSSPVDIVPAGERDIQMTRHAGYLARVVLGIDKQNKFSLWEAIMHMHTWVENFTAKVSGDVMDPQKGVAKLLEFLLKDLEKGRTMPEGWDADMPAEFANDPRVVELTELNGAQRWTLRTAQDWLNERLDQKPDDVDWMADTVDELIKLVAKDHHFSEGHQASLIAYIKRHCKPLGLGLPTLKERMRLARRGFVQEAETHRTIASKVLEELQRFGEIRYDNGQFWQWNGSCFHQLDKDFLYLYVANNVTDSPIVRRDSDYRAVVNVLQRMCKGMLVQGDDRGINFANGFVGEDLFVTDHDPKYGATFTLPFEYNRDAASQCPKWLAFLHSCWGSEPDFDDRVMALQEMFAATLFKIAPRYQRAFLLYGRAGTGKTQILKVLRAMLPPNAVAELGPERWGENFTLVDLIGKAANICGELPENGMITGSIFKQVVEGEPVRAEFKGQDGFVFTPECAHWFASNYLPVSRDTTRGFIRRWLVLDFNHPIREEDKIENLAQILVAEERGAIAAWALEGLHRLLDNRDYTTPSCHEQRLAQMRRINNSVQAFLEDQPGIARGEGSIKCRELYGLYGFHMRDVGRSSPVSFERFMQMLEDLDLDVERDILGDYLVNGVSKLPVA